MASLYHYQDNWLRHNGKWVQGDGWLAEDLADLALSFIERHRNEPFFVYLPTLSPHEGNSKDEDFYGWHAPQAYVDTYRGKGLSEPMARLYGMISLVDDQLGRILQRLSALGLRNDTIIVFLSDNGPIGSSYAPSAEDWRLRNVSGLRGNKGRIYENGVRIPAVIHWPGHLEAGQTQQVASVMDILPTVLDMAGLSMPPNSLPLDGSSLVPQLDEPANIVERPLALAIRSPDFSVQGAQYFLIPDKGRDRSRYTLESMRTA